MFIVVFVIVPNINTAKKITKDILLKRLCACVNIVKNIKSFYWWKGKIDKSSEYLLMIKTRKTLFNKLKKAVVLLHPYAVPEIIALPLTGIDKKYASWLKKETRP